MSGRQDRHKKNATYYANREAREKFVRDFASMKQDADRIESAHAAYETKEEEEGKDIEAVRKFLTNKQLNDRALPAARQKAISRVFETIQELVSKIKSQQTKYEDAKKLTHTYVTRTIPQLERLLNPNQDNEDMLNEYRKLSLDEQQAIENRREEFEALKSEFTNLKATIRGYQKASETVKNKIETHRAVMQAFSRFLRQAGIKPAVAPSVQSAPKVAIFCKEYTPQYYAINAQTATTFNNKVKACLQPTPRMRYDELCAKVDEPSRLTLAQQTPYYYTNPNNPTSILLNHSAGSGKTAAMTLAMSLFVRAGYLPLIVTTDALQRDNTYERAIFIECADWNIQQLLRANGVRNLTELVEKTDDDPTTEAVINAGKEQYKKMATNDNADIWNPKLKVNFRTFSTLCRHELDKRSRIWWDKESPYNLLHKRANGGDENGTRSIFWKTVILMDEVQTMMDEPPPKEELDKKPDKQKHGDIRNVILALWSARKNTNSGPVVIAASATPGNTDFELAMILNLLCKKEEGYQFTNKKVYDYYEAKYPDERNSLATKFKSAHPKPETLLKRMALGRVSYYDSSGSKSVPPMRVVPVQVQLTGEQQKKQSELIQNLRTIVSFVQKRDGSWQLEKDYGSQFARQNKNEPDSYASKEITKFSHKIRSNSIVVDTPAGEQISAKVRTSGYFLPRLKRDGKDRKLRTREDYAQWKAIAPIVSPLYTKTIDCLAQNKARGIRKQYVYINLDANVPQGADLFCAMLGSLLKYKEVGAGDDGVMYSGTYGRVESDNVSTMLDEFNSPANANGSIIDIIVLDRTTKEGVSLYGVGAVYIVGVIDSETDLIQSVARAFRNCRTDPKDLYPTKDVPVLLVTPFAEDSPVHHILLGANRTAGSSSGLTTVLKESSFDREVLKKENDASTAAQNKLTQMLRE